jgi:hypothetical protein
VPASFEERGKMRADVLLVIDNQELGHVASCGAGKGPRTLEDCNALHRASSDRLPLLGLRRLGQRQIVYLPNPWNFDGSPLGLGLDQPF